MEGVKFDWDDKKDRANREGVIRIIGAGYWRKGRQIYEKENTIHR